MISDNSTLSRNINTGIFDGVIGLVQQNKSDFTVFRVPLEALVQGDFETIGNVVAFVDTTDHFIISGPEYNRSEAEIHSNIEESILVVNYDVVIFYFFLLILSKLFISVIGVHIEKQVLGTKTRRHTPTESAPSSVKKSTRRPKVTWNLIRFFLGQGTEISFNFPIQLVLYQTFACAVGMLLLLVCNFVQSDLVTYKKPILINSLQDLLDSGDGFKISFIEASSAASVFKHSHEGSLERKLYERSSAQWAHARDGENYQVMPSNEMLRITRLLEEYKLAYLTYRVPIGIVLGMQCAEADREYSNLHVSTQPIMVENGVLITSFAIDPKVQRRYIKYFRRSTESALHELALEKGHEWTIETILDMRPRASCLNTKAWSDGEKPAPFLGFEHCRTFFIHFMVLLTFNFLILMIEKIYHQINISFRENSTIHISYGTLNLSQNKHRRIFSKCRKKLITIKQMRVINE